MTTATEIVARGAYVLDEHGPHNWHLLITRPVFITDTNECPLGQVYGDYFSDAACDLRADHLDHAPGYYGFDGGYLEDGDDDGNFVDGDALVNKAWETLINDRKDVVTPTEPTFTLSQLREAHEAGRSLWGILDDHTTKNYSLTQGQVSKIADALDSAYGAWSMDSAKIKEALGL